MLHVLWHPQMNCTKTHLPLRRSSNARNSYKKKRRSNALIECFHSRDQHLCKFIGTKESVYIRKEFNSTGLVWDSTWPPFYCFGHQRDFEIKEAIASPKQSHGAIRVDTDKVSAGICTPHKTNQSVSTSNMVAGYTKKLVEGPQKSLSFLSFAVWDFC